MLRKWMLLVIVFVVLSLVAVPAGEAHADPADWRPAAGTGPFEPDDTPAQAKSITDGVTQSRSIVPGTDVDWIRFQIPATAAVILETSGPLPSDTYMSLFRGNLTPLEFNDDDGPGFYASIDRECGIDPLPGGTYYVKIEELHHRASIQNYNLFFNTAPCPGEVVDIYASAATTGPTADKQGSSILGLHGSTRRSFPGLNRGPLQIVNRSANPMMAGQRIIYKVNGVNTSFSEMMAQPNSHLDTVYWLPWYNNIDLDSQLRIANTTTSPATVQVLIGGVPMAGTPFSLPAGASAQKAFPVNNGPVQIVSNQNIVASARVIYKVNGTPVSFTEMMALPNHLLDFVYWLPWYNNMDLDTQLRIANISPAPANIQVLVGGAPVANGSFSVPAGVSTRKSFSAVNNGPVQIISDQNIVVSERVIYRVNGVYTSYSETMAVPNSQLATTYWLPWYNNVDLDTQLRFANVAASTATIRLYIAGQEKITGCTPSNSPYSLAVGASLRVSCAGANNGPVQILSNQNIVAAERVIYKVNNVNTSFTELMALPNAHLNPIFWLPWYNNVSLDSQLRFALP